MIILIVILLVFFLLSFIFMTLYYKGILNDRENELKMMKEDFLELAFLLDQSEREIEQQMSEYKSMKVK